MEKQEILDSTVLQQDSQEEVRPRHMASGGKRFANYLIDLFFVYLLIIILGFIIGLLYGISGNASSIEGTGFRMISYLLGATAIIIYYTLLESISGKSIGKYITKTKVVNKDFSVPNTGKILTRSLCRLIPFEAFSFLGNSSRGWHDSLTDTWVIDENSIL